MKGILFIEPLYHKVLDGSKTQTRRSSGLDTVNDTSFQMNGHVRSPDDWELVRVDSMGNAKFWRKNDALNEVYCTARYKVGEVLYLKEPTAIITTEDNTEPHIGYKFDLTGGLLSRCVIKWSNKLFMPASSARAYVKITGIRCERLLDISDEDCIAEGIEVGSVSFNGAVTTYINYLMHEGYGYDYIDNTPLQSFISLYKFANKMAKVGSVEPHGSLPKPLDVPNIWVWVYQFEYLKNYKA